MECKEYSLQFWSLHGGISSIEIFYADNLKKISYFIAQTLEKVVITRSEIEVEKGYITEPQDAKETLTQS